MRLLISLFLSLTFTFSKAELVKLKFILLNEDDSTSIKIDAVSIKPIKSYFAEEIEHHGNTSVKYQFTNYRFYYSEEFRSNVFEYEAKDYPFHDIYLAIQSDVFCYLRDWSSDYDEENCIHLRADSSDNIKKAYLKPYRFINLNTKEGFKKGCDCLDISLWVVIENDTARVGPKSLKVDEHSSLPKIKTLALTNKYNYLLMVEIYGDTSYYYCYYDINTSIRNTQELNLTDFDYIPFPETGENETCKKNRALIRQKKYIEYY